MIKLLIPIFIKNHKDIKDSRVREAYGIFASILGIVTNVLLFLVKIITGILFNSVAITADAINNLSDSVSSLVTLIGFKLSGKPADAEHPFGHERMEYVAGLIVSFFIIILGLQLFLNAFDKILKPETTVFNTPVLIILTASILVKVWQAIFYRNIGKRIDSITLMAVSEDSRNDVLITVSILVGAVLTIVTGFNLDGYMGLLVAGFIIYSGIKLISDTISPLLGLAPSAELVERIHEKISGYEHILGVHDLTVHYYGPSKCYATVHCEVSAELDIMVSHDIIDSIERDFKELEDIHLVIHMDPVVLNDERANALKEKVDALMLEISPEISMHDFRVVWGIQHSKVIFDVVLPYKAVGSDDDIIKKLKMEIEAMDKRFTPIINVDRH